MFLLNYYGYYHTECLIIYFKIKKFYVNSKNSRRLKDRRRILRIFKGQQKKGDLINYLSGTGERDVLRL